MCTTCDFVHIINNKVVLNGRYTTSIEFIRREVIPVDVQVHYACIMN